MNINQVFDDLMKAAMSPVAAEYAENYNHPMLAWGVGVTHGVSIAMQAWIDSDTLKQAEIDRLKAELEQIDTVRSGLLCEHIWTSQPWRAGTYEGNPVYEAVCAKCGQTGESP